MAEDSKSRGLVQLADGALLDLAALDNATAAMWGDTQADRYVAFIVKTLEQLAEAPTLGRRAERFPDLRTFVAKISSRRRAHGHRIIYREISGGIRVLRILHTAMHWESYLEQ